MAHDETTIRSGDTQSYKWLHPIHSPMFNKGRGISRMVSDFIVGHGSMSCFSLRNTE